MFLVPFRSESTLEPPWMHLKEPCRQETHPLAKRQEADATGRRAWRRRASEESIDRAKLYNQR